jgi:hypothetical protein
MSNVGGSLLRRALAGVVADPSAHLMFGVTTSATYALFAGSGS